MSYYSFSVSCVTSGRTAQTQITQMSLQTVSALTHCNVCIVGSVLFGFLPLRTLCSCRMHLPRLWHSSARLQRNTELFWDPAGSVK